MWVYRREVYSMVDSQGTSRMSTRDIDQKMNDLGLECWEAYSTTQNKNVSLEYIVWFKKWLPEDEV